MLIIIFIFLFLNACSAYANGIAIESFYYGEATYNLILFSVGFILEYYCIRALAHEQTQQKYGFIFLCTLAMNAASTLIGGYFNNFFATLFIIFLKQMNSLITNFSSLNNAFIVSAVAVFGIYLLYVIFNTVIEAPIASFFFPKASFRRVLFWVLLANCLSMGIISAFYLAGFYRGTTQYIITTAESEQPKIIKNDIR